MSVAQAAQRQASPKLKGTTHKTAYRFGAPSSSDTLSAGACACGGSCPRCNKAPQVQAKLQVSQPGDALEHEADRVADQVLRMPSSGIADNVTPSGSTPRISRAASSPSASAPSATPAVHSTLRNAGEPLDTATRAFFEPRFGHDFSGVRVHAGAQAAESTQSVSARAYTVGSNIAFNRGEYSPHSASGRRLLAHELTHVVQQSHGGAPSLQRAPQEAGVCDPANLGTLGPAFKKSEADVKAMGLTAKYLTKGAAEEADFVLYCPHKSTRPLKRLVPCSTVYWIGDAEASKKGKGKDEVWAQQEGETDYFWGYVKKTKISDTVPEPCVRTGVTTLDPRPTNQPNIEAPQTEALPEESETPPTEKKPSEPGTGKTMRVNAPDDPGWAKVRPVYMFFDFGEPYFLPHFLKVNVIAKSLYTPDYFLVTVKEGKYDGEDAIIHRDNLQDDPGGQGYAYARYNVKNAEFYYGGLGPVRTAATVPSKVPPSGTYDIQVPDFPHDKADKYGPYATSWFLVGDGGDKYLHPGFLSLGCATIEIKEGDNTTWPAIWKYLIDARSSDGVVGNLVIENPTAEEEEAREEERRRQQEENPLGGHTTGQPGQRVWHPPGSGPGGVPID